MAASHGGARLDQGDLGARADVQRRCPLPGGHQRLRQQFAAGRLAHACQVLGQAGAPAQRVVEHQFAHEGAAPLAHVQVAFAHQRLHRLAQRVAIDAEALGQRLLVGQTLARCDASGQDVRT